MASMRSFSQLCKRIFPANGFVQNTSWLLGAEIVAKVSRLFTIVALSSQLSKATFGIVMLALACHEIIRTIMRCGAGAQIVQCANDKLQVFAETAKALQWMLAVFLFLLQFIVAMAVGHLYDNDELTQLVQVMAFTYLLFPIVSLNVFLIQREGQFKFLSIRNALCIIAENIITGLLVFSPIGIWAVVVGKFIFALLWVGFFFRSPVQQFKTKIDVASLKYLVLTSVQLFVTELLKASRQHADLFIAGKLFTPEVTGVYAFARSAGIGLSQSLSTAFSGALYPHLCKLFREKKAPLISPKLVLATCAVGSVFIIQGIAAPIYVPLFFDAQWLHAIPIIFILCCCAVPFLLLEVQSTVLRAQGLFKHESYLRLLALVVAAVMLLITLPSSPYLLASTLLASSVLTVFISMLYQFKPWLHLRQIKFRHL
ncbi:hypothetical protein D210916BOD24_25090 [Alteromonas sp. D210916BOD_24]|uniref:oligosaccharide flippase family protein n=1 Tax=Alteromonas sp. D210916BOD_24 TaxID=3157618 RepID=UPI00399C725A